MKITDVFTGVVGRIMRQCRLFLFVYLGVFLFYPGTSVFAAPSDGYQVTNLGTIDPYGSKAYYENDSGSVVGNLVDATSGNGNGFIWSPADGMSMLPVLGGVTSARGINNSEEIAGQSNSHAVLWKSKDGIPLDLGTFGGPTSYAWRITDNGQIVGWADKPDYSGLTVYHAFMYDSSGMSEIGTLATTTDYYGGFSTAYDVNSSGHVVGTASTDGWGYHAYVWDRTNGMVDLGTNPDHPEYEGYATVINETSSRDAP